VIEPHSGHCQLTPGRTISNWQGPVSREVCLAPQRTV
jgi:hypothetical protein